MRRRWISAGPVGRLLPRSVNNGSTIGVSGAWGLQTVSAAVHPPPPTNYRQTATQTSHRHRRHHKHRRHVVRWPSLHAGKRARTNTADRRAAKNSPTGCDGSLSGAPCIQSLKNNGVSDMHHRLVLEFRRELAQSVGSECRRADANNARGRRKRMIVHKVK